MASDTVYTPLPPQAIHQSDPRGNDSLSETEQTMYNEVLAHFASEDPVYTLPSKTEKGELQAHEKFWLSRECILRFLRASKWKKDVAIIRVENTLKWRREFGLHDTVNAELVEPEAVTGKEIIFGYDTAGRPGCYMIPSRQNTDGPTRQIQFIYWMMERAVDLMEPGVENIVLMIKFGGRSRIPTFSTVRNVLSILQEHYPERLGLSLIINVPFLVNAFFKMVLPVIDPHTRQKIKFNPEIFKEGYFNPDMLMKEGWGGEQNFEYVHEKYWPRLVEMCDARVKTWTQNWRELGGKVGISEWEYKTKHRMAADLAEKDGDEAQVTIQGVAAEVVVGETGVELCTST